MMCLHMKWTAHVACNVNFLTETERLFITGSHVYCKSGNILEINDMLQPVSDLDRPTQLRSASKGDLVVPRTRLKLGERAFKVVAPRLWNELPPDIRKLSTLATFMKHLKTFLFCKHYGLVLEQ